MGLKPPNHGRDSPRVLLLQPVESGFSFTEPAVVEEGHPESLTHGAVDSWVLKANRALLGSNADLDKHVNGRARMM